MHSRETAVGALELFTDHGEVVHCGDRRREEGREGRVVVEGKKEGKRLVLNEAHLNKPRRHFSVITFN